MLAFIVELLLGTKIGVRDEKRGAKHELPNKSENF